MDLRSDMANSCLVDGRQKLHRLCHVPHRDRSRGGLRRATGQETGRQGDHVHTYTTIALSDFQQLKVDPTGNVFFTSAFCNCNLKHNRLHVEALKMCRMARINDRTRRVVVSF